MTNDITVTRLTLTKHPEDYEDVFMVVDELQLKLITYSSKVIVDELVNGKDDDTVTVIISSEMNRSQIHELFFTPMRVAWAVNKALYIIVDNACNNSKVIFDWIKFTRDTCGIPNPIFEEELRIANEIMDEIISEENERA